MEEQVAEFSVLYSYPYRCDEPSCSTYPTVHVELIGGHNHLGHHQTCRRQGHIDWAKADLVARQREHDKRQAADDGAGSQ